MPLTRIEVGVEVGFIKKKNRDKANKRSWNIEGIKESKTARGQEKFNSAHADSSNRMVTETSNRARFNQANEHEVQQERGNMTGSTSVNDKGKGRLGKKRSELGRGCRKCNRKVTRNSCEECVIRVQHGIRRQDLGNMS